MRAATFTGRVWGAAPPANAALSNLAQKLTLTQSVAWRHLPVDDPAGQQATVVQEAAAELASGTIARERFSDVFGSASGLAFGAAGGLVPV